MRVSRFAVVLAVVAVLPCCHARAGGVAADATSSPALLRELRTTFKLDGKPVPPDVFSDFGDGDVADSRSIRVGIDVKAAIDSNLYSGEIKPNGAWFSQTRPGTGTADVEKTEYRFIGRTTKDLLVVLASFSGGGSGVFYTLHLLDAAIGKGLDSEGRRYDRILLTDLRDIPLGDRWDGDITIAGDTVAISTTGGLPGADRKKGTMQRIRAERP